MGINTSHFKDILKSNNSSPDIQYEEVQVELKDSFFAPYVPLHKLSTDPKMDMPHISLNYKPQNITLTTDDFDKKKDAHHNKFNYKNTSHFKDMLETNNSLPDKQYGENLE